MSDTLPDNQVSNMACGVLTVAGTDLIYCVGGSAVGASVATARVFYYNPTTGTHTVLNAVDDWPGNPGSVVPGGFAVANNKLYIIGGFNINVASTNGIWEFDPNAAEGSRWTEKVNAPVGIMFAPACTINGIIYVAGASDFQGGLIVDTTNSFSFDRVANTIGSIAPIPRATGETRALSFNGGMLVMGGGRVPPNPSNEVDMYDPTTNTWTTSGGVLVPAGETVPPFILLGATFPLIPTAAAQSGCRAAMILTATLWCRWNLRSAPRTSRRRDQLPHHGLGRHRIHARKAVAPGAPIRNCGELP